MTKPTTPTSATQPGPKAAASPAVVEIPLLRAVQVTVRHDPAHPDPAAAARTEAEAKLVELGVGRAADGRVLVAAEHVTADSITLAGTRN